MKKKIEIIAEAGLNHNGILKNAFKLIDIAKFSGSDYVKFQIYNTDFFINKNFSDKRYNFLDIYKRFKKREFTYKEWLRIVEYANLRKIKIFFSIFDIPSLDLIKRLKINLIKIPSGEINNLPLLQHVNRLKCRVILSTGMSDFKEIHSAIKQLKNCNVSILHCMSEYPNFDPNLNTIKFLQKKFKKTTGYSDHTKDVITPAFAVIAGASIIEKHFTYFKNQKVGDHNFSLNKNELKKMVEHVRLAEKYLGNIKKNITLKEKKLKFYARKGIHLNKNKFKNEKIVLSDIDILRPEGYISVSSIKKILNKKLNRNISKYSKIKKSYLR